MAKQSTAIRYCRCGVEISRRKRFCTSCLAENALINAAKSKSRRKERQAAIKARAELSAQGETPCSGYKPAKKTALDNVIARMEAENARRRAAGLPTLTYGKFVAELKM